MGGDELRGLHPQRPGAVEVEALLVDDLVQDGVGVLRVEPVGHLDPGIDRAENRLGKNALLDQRAEVRLEQDIVREQLAQEALLLLGGTEGRGRQAQQAEVPAGLPQDADQLPVLAGRGMVGLIDHHADAAPVGLDPLLPDMGRVVGQAALAGDQDVVLRPDVHGLVVLARDDPVAVLLPVGRQVPVADALEGAEGLVQQLVPVGDPQDLSAAVQNALHQPVGGGQRFAAAGGQDEEPRAAAARALPLVELPHGLLLVLVQPDAALLLGAGDGPGVFVGRRLFQQLLKFFHVHAYILCR